MEGEFSKVEESRQARIERLTRELSSLEEDYANGHSSIKRVAIYSNEIQKLTFEELVAQGKLPADAQYYDYGVIDIHKDTSGEVLYTRLQPSHPSQKSEETAGPTSLPATEGSINDGIADTLKLLSSLRPHLSPDFARNTLEKINTPNLTPKELQSIRIDLLKAALKRHSGT